MEPTGVTVYDHEGVSHQYPEATQVTLTDGGGLSLWQGDNPRPPYGKDTEFPRCIGGFHPQRWASFRIHPKNPDTEN